MCGGLGQPRTATQDWDRTRQDRIGPKKAKEGNEQAGSATRATGRQVVILCLVLVRSGWSRLLPLPLGLGLVWVGFSILVVGERERARESRA